MYETRFVHIGIHHRVVNYCCLLRWPCPQTKGKQISFLGGFFVTLFRVIFGCSGAPPPPSSVLGRAWDAAHQRLSMRGRPFHQSALPEHELVV